MAIEMNSFYSSKQAVCCREYENYDIVNKVYNLFFVENKDEEFTQDSVTWILYKSLILYKNYTPDQIELIQGHINRENHIWLYDKKEKFFIDVTSELVSLNRCICTKDRKEFSKLGYSDSYAELVRKLSNRYDDDYIVFADKWITLREIVKTIGGGKRKLRKRTKRKKLSFKSF